ncbi:unnamed protein product, partial [Mesorhabditis spiculigera]
MGAEPKVAEDFVAKMPAESARALLQGGEIEVLRWEDDEIALRMAANHSRLPWDELSEQEREVFGEVETNEAHRSMYLFIRNRILQMWVLEPNVETRLEDVRTQMPYPYRDCLPLQKRIHAFLVRYGYINFGRYCPLTQPMLKVPTKVLVIGAGAAGMAAYSQLTTFGFDVQLLEAKSEVGGRIQSYYDQRARASAELGATCIRGFAGNPLCILARQSRVVLKELSGSETLYDEKGQPLSDKLEKIGAELYEKLLATAAYITEEKKITHFGGFELSLEDLVKKLQQLIKLGQTDNAMEFWVMGKEVVRKRAQLYEEQYLCKKICDELNEKIVALEAERKPSGNGAVDLEQEMINDILLRCYRKDISDAVSKYDNLAKRRKVVDEKLQNVRTMDGGDVLINNEQQQLVQHNLAALEWATGAPLHKLSLRHWDHDDPFGLKGANLIPERNFRELLDTLTFKKKEQIRYRHEVKEIRCTDAGCQVVVQRPQAGAPCVSETVTLHADAVICTFPIGVLKRSVEPASADPKKVAPRFTPELPEAKVDAIRKLGSGIVNKLLLIFDRPFWESQIQQYGYFGMIPKAEASGSRGEFFSFLVCNDTPALICLLAGESAELPSGTTTQHLVAKAMSILQKIFGSVTPKEPLGVRLTRWHEDPYAQCAFSYMGKESHPDMYDEIAKPIIPEGPGGKPRVFFAGEHTHRRYPATVHGAFLSGQREAANVADTFLGRPFAKDYTPVCFDIE